MAKQREDVSTASLAVFVSCSGAHVLKWVGGRSGSVAHFVHLRVVWLCAVNGRSLQEKCNLFMYAWGNAEHNMVRFSCSTNLIAYTRNTQLQS